MADKAYTDQPALYSLESLREALRGSEAHLAMVDAIEDKPVGTEVILPLEDGESVPYVWDGDRLLHRGDLKTAHNLLRAGERLAKHAAR